jgi:NAD(P)H-quinone oxidoreductase subunit K
MVMNSNPAAQGSAIAQPNEQIINPIERPQVTQGLSENVILTSVDDLYNWARLSSLWPLLYGTACCFIEFAALIGSRFDFDRFGLIPRSSPRQADLIITAGTITMKMAPALVRLYEQMPEPKYVIAMGACTITGGMFSSDSTTAVRGIDKLIPVDVYLPGCPPRPEAIIDAIIKLRKKIANDSFQERGKLVQTHRYHTVSHQMKMVPDLITGTYLKSAARQVPPKELTEAMGMPVPPALKAAEKEEIRRG